MHRRFHRLRLMLIVLCCCTALPALAQERPAHPPGKEGDRFVVVAGGDMMFGRYFRHRFRQHGGPDPFAHLKAYLDRVDLAVANLETPLMDGMPIRFQKGRWGKLNLTFRADQRYGKIMKEGGIDVVSLATNHAEDCRGEGMRQTIEALDASGIIHAGMKWEGDPYKPAVFFQKNTMVVFFSVSQRRNLGKIAGAPHDHVAYLNHKGAMAWGPEQIRYYREIFPNALILFAIHWGEEYGLRPYRKQRELAKSLIDAGANAILGHHAHVLQPVEVYKEGVIFYNMGNLLFDMFREDGRRTALFESAFERNGDGRWAVDEVTIHPLKLVGMKSGTRPANSKEAEIILNELQTRSRKRHKTAFERSGDRLIWKAQ